MTKARSSWDDPWEARTAPVVAAVEPHTAPATADRAARLAREIGTGLAFVSVRPRRPAVPRRDRDEERSGDVRHGRRGRQHRAEGDAAHDPNDCARHGDREDRRPAGPPLVDGSLGRSIVVRPEPLRPRPLP